MSINHLKNKEEKDCNF